MKKGFTLIELLAVIVILAIIALIATPIVLSIIDETKESALLRSAQFYLDGVETSIATAVLKNQTINDGAYKLKDGAICLDSGCVQKLEVQIKGETPNSGKIYIQDGNISDVTLFLDNKVITKSKDNELVYTGLEYEIGDEVIFNPGDGEKTWNVIDEDATTVTLMLSENLEETVAWYDNSKHENTQNTSDYGPQDALYYLNELTTGWINVDPIKNYTYINNLNGTEKPNGYQKIEIKNGKTKLTHKDGNTTELTGESKARLLTRDEVFEIAQKTNLNLTEENLRAFISDNLGTANTSLQSQEMDVELKSVDECIAFATQLDDLEWLQSESKYIQTYYTVLGMINEYEIETTYNILLPDYLYQNLYSDEASRAYFTLSSEASDSSGVWVGKYDGILTTHNITAVSTGVRPVITVSKSKLLK